MNSKTIQDIKTKINQGLSNLDIMASYPTISADTIDRIRELISHEQFCDIVRKIHVTYIEDLSEGLKYVYSHHPAKDICRISNYSQRYQKIFFDNYHGEPVIVFDNFNSDIPVEIFIGYFSNGYPLMLPAHGYPRTACYTDIYIISRHCINTQYYNRALYPSPDAQKLNSYIDTYIAFNLYSLSLEEITDPFNRENGI